MEFPKIDEEKLPLVKKIIDEIKPVSILFFLYDLRGSCNNGIIAGSAKDWLIG